MKNIQLLYTQSTLAKRCKVSLQTIKNWCLWAGLTPPKKATYFSCDELVRRESVWRERDLK